jgi:O-antigen/teichoic acid export membrane protein
MKDRIAKSFFWIVWSQVTLRVISLVSTLIVMRFLSPKEYGLMALAAIWTNLVVMISTAGLGSAVVRFRNLGNREINSCFWLNVAIAGVGYGALFTAAPFIAAWFNASALTDVLRVVGMTFPIIGMRIVPTSLLRKQLQIDKLCKAETISLVVSTPIVVVSAWRGAGVWALVAGLLLSNLIETLVVFWYVCWRPGLQLGGDRLREVLRFSWATLGQRVCWSLYHQSDRIILGKVAGEVSLGFLSVSRQIGSMPISKLRLVVNQLAVPVMAELQDNLAGLRHSVLRSIRMLTWFVAPICVGVILVIDDFVSVALTDKWFAIVPIVQLLSVHSFIHAVTGLFPPVLMARNRAGFLFGYNFALLILMLPLFWVGASWAGAVGVAATWALIYPFLHLYMASEAFREIELTWKAIGEQLWRPLVAVTFMTLTVVFVRSLITYWNLPVLTRLILSVLTGASVYWTAFLTIGGRSRSEIFETASWIIFRDTKIAKTGN